MSNYEVRDMAARLDRMERRLDGLSAPQLTRSSLENGSIKEYQDGNLVSVIGQQFDGTHGVAVVSGPKPPTPSAPHVRGVLNGLEISYDGEWEAGGDVQTPLDFVRTEVHIRTSNSGLGVETLPRTTIESPRGGTVILSVDFDTDYWVALVAVAASGRRSDVSAVVGPFRALRATVEDLQVDFDGLRGTKIFYGSDTPVTDKADLWLKTPDNVAYRFDIQTSTWVTVQDQGIVKALQDAATANDAAITAGNAALAAQGSANAKTTTFNQASQPAYTGAAGTAVWFDTDDGNKRYVWSGSAWSASTVGAAGISATARQLGAITTYKQASAPTSGMVTGDFWIDSDDNKIYRYSGSAWDPSQDVAINAAVTAAATAQATADGKARIFVQASAPTGLVAGDVGDVWIDTDDSNVSFTWSGTAWVKRQIGNGAIVPQSLIASNVIATGTVSAALLEAVMVLVNTLIAGNPLGSHVRLTPQGLFAYQAATVQGAAPRLAVQLGTSGDDYLTLYNAAGQVAIALNRDGGVNGERGNFRSGLTVNGQDILATVNDAPGKTVASYLDYTPPVGGNLNYGPIRSRMGIAEINAWLVAGRSYTIRFGLVWLVNQAPSQAAFLLTYTNSTSDTAPDPTITSPNVPGRIGWYFNNGVANQWQRAEGTYQFNCTQTGRHRFLLAGGVGFLDFAEATQGPGELYIRGSEPVALEIRDAGPTRTGVGRISQGGGVFNNGAAAPAAAPPNQFYNTGDINPNDRGAGPKTGYYTYDEFGNWLLDTNATIVQGPDPAGQRGIGRGHWRFDLPVIKSNAQVNAIYWTIYTVATGSNRGGTGIWNLSDQFGVPNPGKLLTNDIVLNYGYTAGSWKTIDLTQYADYFRNKSGITITAGPGIGNPQDYVQFDGPNPRLRIEYTQ